jgi:hypothetical protein
MVALAYDRVEEEQHNAARLKSDVSRAAEAACLQSAEVKAVLEKSRQAHGEVASLRGACAKLDAQLQQR